MNKEQKQLHQRLRSVMRRAWSRYPAKFEAKKKATTKKKVGVYKNGKPKYLNYCKCAICGGKFKASECEVDHVVPAGSFNDRESFKEWVAKLLYDLEYQVVCTPCHAIKTHAERYNMSFKEAEKQKEVIAYLSLTAAKQKAYLKKHEYTGISVSNEEKREKLYRKINNL